MLIYDAPYSKQLLFQDPSTPIMEGIANFHHDLNTILIVIGILVLVVLITVLTEFNEASKKVKYPINYTHDTLLEQVWTIIPAIILVMIFSPSYSLLCAMDEEIENPALTVKITAYQWFWKYEVKFVSEFLEEVEQNLDFFYRNIYVEKVTSKILNNFKKNPLNDDEVIKNQKNIFNNLETNYSLLLPEHLLIRFVMTSVDVLHSFCVPSFGIKLDCTPGRLTETHTLVDRVGKFYGQCSELCGVEHAFMPISVIVLTVRDYMDNFNMKFGIKVSDVKNIGNNVNIINKNDYNLKNDIYQNTLIEDKSRPLKSLEERRLEASANKVDYGWGFLAWWRSLSLLAKLGYIALYSFDTYIIYSYMSYKGPGGGK